MAATDEAGQWVFDIQPGLFDPVARTLSVFLWLCAILISAAVVGTQVGAWSALIVSFIGLCLAGLYLARLTFHHCDFPVRFTPLGVCALNQGQMALRLSCLCCHPQCTVLTLCAHDPGQSKKESRLILWRYQYSVEQYRRMTLVLRWLSAKEHHE